MNTPSWRRIPGTWSAWRRILGRRPEDDVDAELRFHFDERIAELIARGTPPEIARATAAAEFGDVEAVRARLHAIDHRIAGRHRRADWWEGMAHDLRYVFRGLARSPGFTAMVVVTLALGIGANAAIFSVLDRLFIQAPPAVHRPDEVRRLLQDRITRSGGHTVRSMFSFTELRELKGALPAGVSFAGHSWNSARLGRGADAQEIGVVSVVGDHFGVLGVRPSIGRFFTEDEARIETFAPVAVISERLWKERFGGTASALGQPLFIGPHRYTVIGVAPPDFRGVDLDVADAWIPASTNTSWTDRKANWFYEEPGTGSMEVLTRTPRPADAGMFESVAALAIKRVALFRDSVSTVRLGTIPEATLLSKANESSIGVATRLAGVSAIVLLIACANVANLLLARGLRRRREIAVRLALGVSRRRLVLQLLSESIAVSVMAGAVALAFAGWAAGALRTALMPTTAWGESVLGMRIILVVLASSLVTGLAAGMMPALQLSDPNLAVALKEGGRSGSAQRPRTRAALLVVQAALSVVLLAGAGVFLRSLGNVEGVDVGYDAKRLVYAEVASDDDDSHAAELGAALPLVMERVRRMAGVEQVTLTQHIPMDALEFIKLHFPGRDAPPTLNKLPPFMNPVTPAFFSVGGMKLRSGRVFTDADREGGAPVVIVNETMARTAWPGQSALGQCFVVGQPSGPCREVVGIVSDAHSVKIVEPPTMQYYVPIAQWQQQANVLMMRIDPRRAAAVAKDVKAMLAKSLGPWAIPSVRRMDEVFARELRPYRLGASLFSAAGILALLVAAVGVYSSISYSISQRTYEMGIRIALGARSAQILRLVVGEGLRVVLLGIVVGAGITVAAGRLVTSFLYGVTPHDPAVIGISGALLVAVAIVAAVVPALRATRADPAAALRAE